MKSIAMLGIATLAAVLFQAVPSTANDQTAGR